MEIAKLVLGYVKALAWRLTVIVPVSRMAELGF